VYGESLVDIDPPAGKDDDDAMEDEGEEKDEGEGGAAGDDEARNQETSYMSLSPPLALSHPGILRSQPFAVFKVLAVTGSEGEGLRPYVLKYAKVDVVASPSHYTISTPLVSTYLRAFTSRGRQFWSVPISGGGIRGNVAVLYGPDDGSGSLVVYSGGGIKLIDPKNGAQKDFFEVGVKFTMEDVHLTVRGGYIYGCGEGGLFRVKVGGGGSWGKVSFAPRAWAVRVVIGLRPFSDSNPKPYLRSKTPVRRSMDTAPIPRRSLVALTVKCTGPPRWPRRVRALELG
jgi:hypothetical protein